MICAKCKKQHDHAILIREGDPIRIDQKPDKSTLHVVRLCEDHWVELRKFLGL